MKRYMILAALAVLMMLAAGCGKSEPKQEQNNTLTSSQDAGEKQDTINMETDSENEQTVFFVSLDFPLESDAWLGIVPTGTVYQTEEAADDVDMLYTYCDNFGEEKIIQYRFPFSSQQLIDLGTGVYDMVLCSSDNAETGKVLMQIGIEISSQEDGGSIVLDYENVK